MKLTLTVLLALFTTSLAQAHGIGVKNGGSGFQCLELPLAMAEYVSAGSFLPPNGVEDRNLFFSLVLNNVPNADFKALLQKQWEAYGDSANWPTGTLDGSVVYYSAELPGDLRVFSPDGTSPPFNSNDPICKTDYNLEMDYCCTRVLISFFDEDSLTPTKIAANYNQLTRYQKNILELHEAIYRVASDLAKLPMPSDLLSLADPTVKLDVENYLDLTGSKGVFPSDIVVPVGKGILNRMTAPSASADPFLVEYPLSAFWSWSQLIFTP